jgi:hypothetical protein
MRRNLISIVVVCVFFLFSCGQKSSDVTGPTPTASGQPDERVWGLLSEVSGDVLARVTQEDEYALAENGYIVEAYGQVMTKTHSKARLDLSNGSLVRLSADTIFTLQPAERRSDGLLQHLQLSVGKLWIILNGGALDVETPSGLASVRGSYLSVSYNPETGETYITCLEGTCTLTDEQGSVEIGAGQTAVISHAGEPPVVGEMSEEEVQEWLDNNPEASLVVPPTETPETPPATEETTQPEETDTPVPSPTPVTNTGSGYNPPPSGGGGTTSTEPEGTSEPVLLTPTVTIANVAPQLSVTGEPVSVAVEVAGSGAIPSGTVEVKANGVSICSATLSEGFANCVGGISVAGSASLIAYYMGDGSYYSAQSSPMGTVVDQAATTTTIQNQTPNPSLVGTSVTFEATVDVDSPGSGTPYGSVIFSDGTYSCVVSAAPWICSITFPTDGAHLVTASYSGDSNFMSSISEAVPQDVLLTPDTYFLNDSGPNSPFVVSSIGADCTQSYSVEVMDMDGVSEVSIEYSLDDDTFMIATVHIPLTVSGSTWTANISIPGSPGQIVYWRFVATDGASNKTFFGGGAPYTDGYPGTTVSSYFFFFASGLGGTCPVVP